MMETSYCNESIGSLQAMLKQEERCYGCSSTFDSDYSDVRRSLVEVFDEAYDLCQLQNRDTVSVAVSYLDRFMSAQSRYVNTQLAAMTCFYLAVKLYEPTVIPPAMLVEVFQRALDMGDDEEDVEDDASTDSVVTAESVESMEISVLPALNWKLNPPTPMMFVRQILSCLPNTRLAGWKQAAEELAQAHLQVSVKSNETMSVRASTQAVAALFLAVEKLPVSRRAGIYKFLLQASRRTSPEEQREVLTAQGILKRLVPQVIVVASTPKTTSVLVKRPVAPTTTPSEDEPPAKKPRMVRTVSFTSSPRSTFMLA